jgi:hypothetical protein
LKFNSLAIVGVLFVVLGIAGLAHPNVVMPAKKQELEIAGNKVIMGKRGEWWRFRRFLACFSWWRAELLCF